ncbi:MAG: chemotaxis protein CheX [Lachnospiraceae bacterium]|nr:chemotaxis protein CheX [Lachnospiraceae bacterium]
MEKKNHQMPGGMENYSIIADEAVRMLSPYMDEKLTIDNIGIVEDFSPNPGAWQIIESDSTIVCSLYEESGGLLEAVSNFAGERFEGISERDALDAAAELLNYISGAYAKEMSERGTACELQPPDYGNKLKKFSAVKICRVRLKTGKSKMGISIGVLDI